MARLALKTLLRFPLQFLNQLWSFLTEPFEPLPKPEDRRRAVISTVVSLFAFLAVGGEQITTGKTPSIMLVLLFTGYIFSRTRWYKIAVLVLLVALSFPSFQIALIIPNPDSNHILALFAWIILPLIFCSLIYSTRVTFIYSVINSLLLIALIFIRDNMEFSVIRATLGFYGLAALFIITVMVQRDEIEKDRQSELIESGNKLSQEVIERERFAEQAQRRADQLSMVNKINHAISNLQDLHGILQLIYEQVKNNFNPDVFFIALYDEKSQMISFPLMVDGGKFWDEPARNIHQTTSIARAIESNQSFLWNRNEIELQEARNSSNRVGDPNQVAASIVIVPLKAGSRAIGALSIQSYKMKAYSEEELALLGAIAQQATVAIENARLFEDASKRAQRLAILNEIGGEISTLSNLSTLMEIVYLQIQYIFPTDLFFIGLYDRQKNELSFPIMYDNGRRWDQPSSPITDGTFSGKTILTRKPLLINEWADPNLEGASSPIIVGDHTRTTLSLMYTPMLFGQESIGVISAQSYKPNAYTEEDLNLLAGIAHQVAIAIENTRLLEETKQNAQSLLTLNEVARAVSELTDLSTLLDGIYEQAQKAISPDAFYVGLYEPNSDEIVFPIMYDDGKRYEPSKSPVNEGTTLSHLREGGKATLINRTPAELGLVNSENMLGNTARRSASLMVAPLTTGNQVIGVISAQSYELNAYAESDLNLLTGIANQVAVAIQNARLLEEIKQKAQHLSILNEVARAVAALKDLPELLETVFKQAQQNLDIDTFYVGLYNPEKDEVIYPIMYDDGKRYDAKPDKVSEESFLYKLLHGGKAKLINRTVEELGLISTTTGMLGDTSKLSASLMIVPLASGDQVIGVFSVQSYTLNAYDENDLNLLVRIANQVSIAIENSHLYTAAQQEITERQRVEEQLRAAETKYRELVERVPAVIYSSETGATGRWFYVSPQIETLLGFTPEEWISDPDLWYQQIHPEDRESAVTTEAKLLAEGSRLETEYRMFTKDGRLLWIHDESTNVSKSENQLYIVQGILTDISIRKQAELTLKESEEKYHSLFNTAERQARELTLLSEVQNALALELDLPVLIHTVVEAIAKTFGYIFVSLYKLESGVLQLQHQVGYSSVIEKISAKEGVSGRVISSGQSILISDVAHEPNFLRADQQIRSEVCVPLFDGDEIFGILNVESSQEYQLNEDDLRLMNLLSEQINIAIRRARLYADRAESLRREQHINEFAHAISSTLDLPNILEIVARLSVELVGAETGTVNIMSEDGEEMTNIYDFNEASNLNSKLPKGQGLTWFAYEKGRPIVVDEYAQHPQASPEWSSSGLHAFMGVPITAGEKRLGVIALYNRTPDKKFTQRDVSLIEAVAQEVAIAIQNARLFDALQKELQERQRIELELQKERDFAVQIMNTLGQGVAVSTPDGFYEYVNPRYAKMLGYNQEDMIDKPFNIFVLPEDVQRLNEERRQRQVGESTTYELRLIHSDGHIVHTLVVGVPRYINGKIQGSIAAITDLTERKQIELEREALLKELEAKNAELERFTYSVSHDLKSPLVTIGGFVGYLEADIKRGETHRIENTIGRIRDAAKKMQRLLDELLELSRIGRLINPPAEVPFEELAREALELAHGQLTEKQVQVKVEANLPIVNVDRVRMVEVLQNLIVNAIKFMGGQENPIIEIGMQIMDAGQAFFVKDNGIGIAPQYHEKIFGLFDKLDATSDGTGIGLALVKRIVEVHGGTIWVESEIEKGATFFFTLEPKKQ